MSDGNEARRDTHGGHGPAEPTGQEPKQTHAGNGTVNHGPADKGPGTQEPAGLSPDELALRRMLHSAVRDVEPGDGTLDHLRRAVPARRARKRQAAVGMAAAVLFIGTAVPALVHVTGATGPGVDPSVAGNASQAQGGTGQGEAPAGGQSGATGSSGRTEDEETSGPTQQPKDEETGSATGSAAGAGPSASSPADLPPCMAQQLGPAVASSAAPDSAGAVYGSFRVTNVSSDSCTVTGPGSVTATPQGAADPARIGAARHAAGDAAAALPDPSLESAALTLASGASYEVRFAWVPSETCPATGGDTTGGGTGDPTSDPSPTGEPAATPGTSAGGDTGTTTQLVTEEGPADGSVTVSYTPEGGSGPAAVTVANACAGTVYWTGALAGT